jgi:hypothetical protein
VSIADGGTLPSPGNEVEADAIVDDPLPRGGARADGPADQDAKKNEGAFINVLDDRTQRLGKAMRKRLNEQVFGDGTGVKATLTSSPSAATTFTVDTTQYLFDRHGHRRADEVDGCGHGGRRADHGDQQDDEDGHGVGGDLGDATTDGVYRTGSRGLESDGLRNITGQSGCCTGSTLGGGQRGVERPAQGRRDPDRR